MNRKLIKFTITIAIIISLVTAGCSDLSKLADEAEKTFNEQAVTTDAESLTELSITYASGDTADSVTTDFTVPTSGGNGTVITWESSNPDVISISDDGTTSVTQPTGSSVTVTLTATITKGDSTYTKKITITVLAEDVIYHIITFYANDGSGTTATQTIAENTTAALNANSFTNATDNSLFFAGWATTSGGEIVYLDCANYPMGTADAELYAIWQERNGITVNTDIEGESNVTITSGGSIEITKGASASFSIPGTFSSYQWYMDGDSINGATSSSVSVDTSSMSLGVHSLGVLFSDADGSEYSETITIYVVWTGATYSIAYNSNGSTGGSVPTDSSEYITGDTATILGNTGSLVRTDYVFTGWNAESDLSGIDYGAGAEVTFSGSDITLYAKWVPASSIVFKEDFSTAGYLNGTTPDVGGNWQATSSLRVVDGILDTNTAGPYTTKLAYAAFTEALEAGETLTLTFETTITAGTFTNQGYAGFSLYTGFSSSLSPGTERVFMGSIASYGLWGIDQTIPGSKTLISPDFSTEIQTAYFTYDYDTGGWSFTVGGRELSSGTGTAGLALDAVRIGAGPIDYEYADIAITNIYIDKQ